MNRYIKLSLVTLVLGIPLGLFVGILSSIMTGFLPKVTVSLIVGFFLSGIMVFTLELLHRRSVKHLSYGVSEETIGVYHVRNINLQLSYDKVFDDCIASFELIKGKIKREDRLKGIIIGSTFTLGKGGNIVSFKIERSNNNKIKVEVSSRPVPRTRFFDFGKNLENVEKIASFLKECGETAYNKTIQRT